MYIPAWRTVYALTRVLFWCLFPELRSNEGNKQQINTRVSAYTVRHKSTYIILFLTWHNESINNAKNEDLHTSSPCLTRSLYVTLMTSQSIGDHVTMTRQLWREHVKAISNSLDIDFIHGDIHGRSCKKTNYSTACYNMRIYNILYFYIGMFCTDTCHKQPLGEVLHSVEICFVTSLLKVATDNKIISQIFLSPLFVMVEATRGPVIT